MSVKITYLVHSTSTDNLDKTASGWKDVPLSELGQQQAVTLGEKLKDYNFAAFFCSDLVRAVQTTNLAFSSGVEIVFDRRLRECNYGDYNGQSAKLVESLQEKYINEKFPNGESYEDVKNRIADFLNFIKKNYEGKRVAIVSHKVPQLALDVLLKNKTWKQALVEDWRKTGDWQPGWQYVVK